MPVLYLRKPAIAKLHELTGKKKLNGLTIPVQPVMPTGAGGAIAAIVPVWMHEDYRYTMIADTREVLIYEEYR